MFRRCRKYDGAEISVDYNFFSENSANLGVYDEIIDTLIDFLLKFTNVKYPENIHTRSDLPPHTPLGPRIRISKANRYAVA